MDILVSVAGSVLLIAASFAVIVVAFVIMIELLKTTKMHVESIIIKRMFEEEICNHREIGKRPIDTAIELLREAMEARGAARQEVYDKDFW